MDSREIAAQAARELEKYQAFTKQLERDAERLTTEPNDESREAKHKRQTRALLYARIDERKNAEKLLRVIEESRQPSKEKIVETVDHSPLPWTFTYFTKPDGSDIETPQDVADTVAHSSLQCEGTTLWGVTLDEKDEHGRSLVVCYTGNGPHSEANARLIVAAINALNITQPATASSGVEEASPMDDPDIQQLVNQQERIGKEFGHVRWQDAEKQPDGSYAPTPTKELNQCEQNAPNAGSDDGAVRGGSPQSAKNATQSTTEAWKSLREIDGDKYVLLSEVGQATIKRIAAQARSESELNALRAEVEESRNQPEPPKGKL